MGRLSLQVATEALAFAEPFRISGYVFDTVDVVVATLRDGEHEGRGEASGVYYLGDDVPVIVEQLEGAREAIEKAGGSVELIERKNPAELAAAKKGKAREARLADKAAKQDAAKA